MIPPVLLRAGFGLYGRLAPRQAAHTAAGLLTRPRGRNPPQPWEHEPTHPLAEQRVLPGDLHALQWGSAGPLVLGLHGWRGRPTQFGRLAEALVAAGYRVVVLDAPGHGRSRGLAATPRLLGEALVEAGAALGEVHALIGHSLGGAAAPIALELGLRVRRLVMIGSPARPSRLIARYADQLGLPLPARCRLDEWFDAHAGRPAALLDPVALAPHVEASVMVVHDEDDEIIPVADARLLEAAWPPAQMLYTRGLGHRNVLSDPEVVAAVRNFIVG